MKRAIDTIREFTELADLEIEVIEDFRERKVDSVWIDDFEDFTRKQWRDFSFKLSEGNVCKRFRTETLPLYTG